MILKENNNCDFKLRLNLNINYDLEYMDLTVTILNKKKHTMQLKQFAANEFSQALAYYNQQNKMFMCGGDA